MTTQDTTDFACQLAGAVESADCLQEAVQMTHHLAVRANPAAAILLRDLIADARRIHLRLSELQEVLQ